MLRRCCSPEDLSALVVLKYTVVVSLQDGASGQEVASFRQTLWDVLDTTDSFADLGREVADFMYRIQYK